MWQNLYKNKVNIIFEKYIFLINVRQIDNNQKKINRKDKNEKKCDKNSRHLLYITIKREGIYSIDTPFRLIIPKNDGDWRGRKNRNVLY